MIFEEPDSTCSDDEISNGYGIAGYYGSDDSGGGSGSHIIGSGDGWDDGSGFGSGYGSGRGSEDGTGNWN